MSKKGKAHGGAWKVAYADFVTAMMALFMVLWIAAQDQKIREIVAETFRNPFRPLAIQFSGILPEKEHKPGKGEKGPREGESSIDMDILKNIEQDLLRAIEIQQLQAEQVVKIELTPEGLRITVFDRTRKPIFEKFSDKFTPYGAWVFSVLAWQIARYQDFLVDLEGHSERLKPEEFIELDLWDLTARRANAARKQLLDHGVKSTQFVKVAGFADTQPLLGVDPADESNRRVTVLLKPSSKR